MDSDGAADGGSATAPDEIDDIRAAWTRLRPGLDTEVVDIVGRLLRAAAIITRHEDEFLRRFELSRGEFDILSALRRAGEPRSPGTLRTISLASGPATTKRLQSLERRGLVARSVNPVDARGAFIALTPAGTRLIDKVFPELIALETSLFDELPVEVRAATAARLRDALAALAHTTE
jgi:DNA-binding MarR family transcriptional regulator